MRTRSHKKKRKPAVMTSAKNKGKFVMITPPESKERDTQVLSRMIAAGTADPQTESLSRLVGKAKPQKEQTAEPEEPDLKKPVHHEYRS